MIDPRRILELSSGAEPRAGEAEQLAKMYLDEMGDVCIDIDGSVTIDRPVGVSGPIMYLPSGRTASGDICPIAWGEGEGDGGPDPDGQREHEAMMDATPRSKRRKVYPSEIVSTYDGRVRVVATLVNGGTNIARSVYCVACGDKARRVPHGPGVVSRVMDEMAMESLALLDSENEG